MTTLAQRATSGWSLTLPRGVRLMLKHKGLLIGAVITLIVVLCAIFAPLLAPYSPYTQSLMDRLVPPVFMEGGSWAHPLGTDHLGRDYLSRLIYGTRISLIVGFGTVALSSVIGVGLGLAAGYFGGRVDLVVTFLLTVRLSMPIMLVVLALVGLVGNSLPLVIAVMAGFLWDRFIVVTRSLTMQMRAREFVAAAKSAGCSDLWIMFREILPNLAGPLVVIATLEAAHAVLLEAALSFLGLGVQPPAASWGLMIAEARTFVFFESWLVNIPGAAIFIFVLGLNLLGDGIRDIAAPGVRT
jgi:peptide/nickel transport system permease protein